MARLIVKSPYIKCGEGSAGARGYLKYIGTREHVELVPDGHPPTQKQEQLIKKLLKEYPDAGDLPEYTDYEEQKTKVNASSFISRALEQHWDTAQHSDVYMKYIATRPRAERIGSHGLFGDEARVDLDAVARELGQYTGNVWTHIISLHRDDAVRYGYDHASAWRNLLLAHRNEIADAMHIPPKDFRWYAAFHDEGDHPHVHMMAWSVQPGQARLTKDGIRQIKSALTNDVFRYELNEVLEQKSVSRNALVREARDALRDLTEQLRQGVCNHPDMEQKMQALSMELGSVSGKKTYGYLPKRLKSQVDEIVDDMERLPAVSKTYDHWLELLREVESYYKDEQRQRKKLSEEKEFRAIKNAVIKEAERIRTDTPSFEDRGIEGEDEMGEACCTSDAFWRIYSYIADSSIPASQREQSMNRLEALAEQGNADAQYMMGRLFRDGPIPIPDTGYARYWFEQAARQGVVEAQYSLGKLLLTDDVEVQDIHRGIQWLEIASRNGNSFAAYRLGKEYLRGEIVAKDAQKAKAYFTRSAEDGNPYGQYMLGKLLLTEGDTERGLDWMWQASKQGNAYAQFFLDRERELHPPSVMLSTSRLLHHMANIFRDTVPKDATGQKLQISRKRLQELIQQKGKKAAMEYAKAQREYGGPTMSAPW